MERYLFNVQIALEAIWSNKVRSILTALGIIFGVGAVIAMLAVGNGAQQEILNQMKLIGVNNIVVNPIFDKKEGKLDEGQETKKSKFSPGLQMADVQNIRETIPNISLISPEIEMETHIVKSGKRKSAKLIGIEPSYFQVYDFSLGKGRMFSQKHLQHGNPVCIIGKTIETQFFSQEDPIGKRIKCGGQWLTVIGVMEERKFADVDLKSLGIRNANLDVYIPISTMLIRYKDRARVTKAAIEKAMMEKRRNRDKKQTSTVAVNYHQLSKLVIQVKETEQLAPTADILQRMLNRRHYDVADFEISIPELLLKQQQRTKDIFNIVLGAIAGISLIVGGIGIMNIMLASVMERIKEIGLRISLGAQKKDIVIQFLAEAVLISLSGGVIGVVLGVSMSVAISQFADIPTILSLGSIFLSFGVAATVGIVFGIMPAKKAAEQNPIESLRYE